MIYLFHLNGRVTQRVGKRKRELERDGEKEREIDLPLKVYFPMATVIRTGPG